MKKQKIISLLFLITAAFTACDNDDNKDTAKVSEPTVKNIEIGTANNKRALIGRDFHFNADVIVGDKISIIEKLKCAKCEIKMYIFFTRIKYFYRA
jgi:hypothetical protein